MHIKRIFLIFIFLLSFNAHSAVVSDLYSVELEVDDQTTSVRLQTFKKAFDDVVVKVSGTSEPLKSKAFKQARVRANRFVKQFNYENYDVTKNNESLSLLKLKVVFEQKLIESLLRNNNFPIWGQVRPSILVLVSKQKNNRHEIISDESSPESIEKIDELAGKYGLPLQFPLLDLADLSNINPRESALNNKQASQLLAKRYQSDIVLMGEIIETNNNWQARWESEFSGNVFKWKFSASTKESMFTKSMAHLASLLANEYALDSAVENKNDLIIKVQGVTTLEQYLKVMRYFSSLSVVEKTRLKNMTASSVSFNLGLRNSPEELQRLIELGNIIEQIEFPEVDTQSSSEEEAEGSIILNYQIL